VLVLQFDPPPDEQNQSAQEDQSTHGDNESTSGGQPHFATDLLKLAARFQVSFRAKRVIPFD